jgi:ACDE family multidrug resistance protein
MSSSFASIVKKYRNVIVIALGTLAVTLGLGIFYQTLSIYLLFTAYGYSNPSAIIIYFIVTLIVTPALWPVMGWLSDRFGRKKVIVPAFFVYSFVAFLYPSIVVFPLLFFYSITGILSAMTVPASNALIADSVKTNRRGAAFGATAAVYSLGSFIVPAIANAVFYGWNFSGVFYSGAVIMFSGAVLCLLFLVEPTQSRITQQGKTTDSDLRKGNASAKDRGKISLNKDPGNAGSTTGLDKSSRRIVIISLITISFLLPFTLSLMRLLQTMMVFDYASGDSGLLSGVQLWLSLIGVSSLVVGGVLADLIGRKRTLLVILEIAIALSLVMSVVFVVELYFWFFIAMISVATFVSGALTPVVFALLADITPARRRGLTYGLVILGIGIGQLLLAILTGFLYPTLFGLNGLLATFGITLVLTIVATILVGAGVVEPETAY